MLLEFRVTNYRSICEEQVLSLIPATKLKEYPTNILTKGRHKALNALALYGANDSGKSSLLQAIGLLRELVQSSASQSSTKRLPADPFLLRLGWESRPTQFEISFIDGDTRYRYGVAFTATEVVREWLFRKGAGREVPLFEREGDIIDTGAGFEAARPILDAAIAATRPNALFLSLCDTLNIAEATRLMRWFGQLTTIDGLNTATEQKRTVELLQEPAFNEKIRDYIRSLSFNVLDVEVKEEEVDPFKGSGDFRLSASARASIKWHGGEGHRTTEKAQPVLATHRIYDEKGQPTTRTRTWDWAERESAGAQKALELSGPILWALAQGSVLVIDEIEARMHSYLTLNTIELFLNPQSNPLGAQLLFATHDTNLLTYAKLRRDQICFAEKNQWEGTETYALSDFQYLPPNPDGTTPRETERPDTDKEKRYFEGRYGAVPASADLQRFLRNAPWPSPEN